MLNAVTAADAGSYKVTVTNSAGSVTSAVVTLTVTPASATVSELTDKLAYPALAPTMH